MYFKLFANCLPVSGASVNIICDLQRRDYLYITDGLYEILTEHRNKPVRDILAQYPPEHHQTINGYFDILITKEMGFFTEYPGRFPEVDLSFSSPGLIDNAIIDMDASSSHDHLSVMNELDLLGCRFLELRFWDTVSIEDMMKVLVSTKNKRFKNIDIYLQYRQGIVDEIKAQVFERYYGNVGRIYISSAPADEYLDDPFLKIILLAQSITSESCCGNISPRYFSYALSTFTEGLKYNTCLNKKISLDRKGRIKNCPSMTSDHGRYGEASFRDAILSPGFKDPWSITKDQIEVCKDCQFRYICTDCRAFLDESLAKPAKCDYDPYTNKWMANEEKEEH